MSRVDTQAKRIYKLTMLLRSNVQEEIQKITASTKNRDAVKIAFSQWLSTQDCTDFDRQQIMNDLTSYKEYLELVN